MKCKFFSLHVGVIEGQSKVLDTLLDTLGEGLLTPRGSAY